MARSYKVEGYPRLRTARPQGTADQLFQGDIDVADLSPGLLSKLEAVGEMLKKNITIFSGYRTSSYSESVGGFAGDPHSRGIAVDANVNGRPIGRVRGAIGAMAAQGLVSGNQPDFYHGAPDPSHVQLGSSENTLGSLWTQAGGSAKLANIMAAIALAESGGRIDAKGGPNSDGSYDYGLWQINSSHRAYNPSRLLSDPAYNAQAAVQVERSQGLTAWTTYKTGAYRAYLQGAKGHAIEGRGTGVVRPGGDASDGSSGGGDPQDIAFYDYLNPWKYDPFFGGPTGMLFHFNPLKVFNDARSAINSVDDFLKWIGWLFHPRNILRIVEVTIGLSFLFTGLVFAYKDSQRGGGRRMFRRGGLLRSAAFQATPTGRAMRLSKRALAEEGPRRVARREETHQATQAVHRAREATHRARTATEHERTLRTRRLSRQRKAPAKKTPAKKTPAKKKSNARTSPSRA
jgi:hypothetical protein